MVWFAIGFVLMVILSMCSYWTGYKRYVKYEKEKNECYYNRALLFFKLFFTFNIIGIIILIVGFLFRINLI